MIQGEPQSEVGGAMIDPARLREDVATRLRAWVLTQPHYYVGYEFRDEGEAFWSLVDLICSISATPYRSEPQP